MDVLTRCRGSNLNLREGGRKVDNCVKVLLDYTTLFTHALRAKPLILCDLLLAAPYTI